MSTSTQYITHRGDECNSLASPSLRLQRSRYNYFVKREDGIVGYNARTGAFASISTDAYEALSQTNDEWPDSIEHLSLFQLGFLHSGDETELIVDRYLEGRERPNDLNLTIVPTLACNFSCDYCFQNEYREAKVMSEGVQDAVLRFVRLQMQQGRHDVSCTWFGGEPLLAANTVTCLSKRIHELVSGCDGKIVRSEVITNGIKLDGDTAKSLREAGITRAQVTFDALVYCALVEAWHSRRGGTAIHYPAKHYASTGAYRDHNPGKCDG